MSKTYTENDLIIRDGKLAICRIAGKDKSLFQVVDDWGFNGWFRFSTEEFKLKSTKGDTIEIFKKDSHITKYPVVGIFGKCCEPTVFNMYLLQSRYPKLTLKKLKSLKRVINQKSKKS